MYQIKLLNEISDIIYDAVGNDKYNVSKEMANPDAILVRSADMNAMELPSTLIAIGRAGAGVNNIPLEKCSQSGIVVFNTPGANANAVKELVVAAMLLASRDIVGGIAWCQTIKEKGADVPKLVEKGKNKFIGPELKGKKLGVIGLGAIGAMVANIGQSLGMEVFGFDPFISVDHAWMLSRNIKKAATQEAILAQCDYISIHVPLSDKTREMFNMNTISTMKTGAVLLNFSRGELVSNPAILMAIADGKLSRYVTDFPTDDLLGVPGVIAIPHLGASTPESEDNCAQMASAQLVDYLEHGIIKNSVNFPECDPGMTDTWRLTIAHANIPNTVGSITSAIAAYDINIANMINKSRGQVAYTVLDLDDEPNDALIGKIGQVEGVCKVRLIAKI